MSDHRPRGLGAMFRDAPAVLGRRLDSLERQLGGLGKAVTEARGYLDDEVLDSTMATVTRSSGRLRLSSAHTVVAIAGSTGSGKSTTFNALAGMELSDAGAQRPTTSIAKALIWSEQNSDDVRDLLEWLGVPGSNQFHRGALAPAPPRGALPDGLILLDLPDHDSFEAAHHREAARVVELADVLIWVVDPQKYADAAIHERFLRPLAGHREVTIVVLNHIDTVPEDKRPGLMRELRKVLVADGMRDPRILGISARHGIGVAELRTAIQRRVESGRNAEQRAEADIAAEVARLESAVGQAPRMTPEAWVADLERRVATAAGVPAVVARRERIVRAAAERRMAWPAKPREERRQERDQLRVGPVDRSAVNAAVRSLADQVCRDLTEAWSGPVRVAATAGLEATNDHLDAELGALDIPEVSGSGFALPVAARVIAALCVVAGVVLLGASLTHLISAWWPVPALLVLGLLVEIAGRKTRRSVVARAVAQQTELVQTQSGRAILRVMRTHVIGPVDSELAALGRVRAGLDAATRFGHEAERRRRVS